MLKVHLQRLKGKLLLRHPGKIHRSHRLTDRKIPINRSIFAVRDRVWDKTNLRPLLVRLNPLAVKLPVNRLPILLAYLRQHRLFELRRHICPNRKLDPAKTPILPSFTISQKRMLISRRVRTKTNTPSTPATAHNPPERSHPETPYATLSVAQPTRCSTADRT